MNKVLVHIYVVKIGQEFEVFLPPNKKVCDIIVMITRSIHELTNGLFPLTYQNLLFDTEQNIFCDPTLSLKDAHINNGKKLLFF